MVQTGQPIRVIYAKLTATGAYDVVAKTPNIPLDRARTLAERLLPGNPPLDANPEEEIAHVTPPEGGHIVVRFARYGWHDGERGDVFITDLLWVSADDFRRARNHAFALVPRTERVFDVLTELHEDAPSARSAADDLQRVRALHDHVAEARTVIASAATAEAVLLLHQGDRAGALELFTLLLPPSQRARLTFQTQAYRVPATLPRITLVDRLYANLRDAPWKILPSVDVDVPLELAGRLVALAAEPELLALVHEVYDDAHDDMVDLRTVILRLTRLAGAARSLRERDATHTLQLLDELDERERGAVLRRLRTSLDPHSIRAAIVQLATSAPERLLALLRELDAELAAGDTTAALIDNLPANAPDPLLAELAARAARQGDVTRLLALLGTDRRTIAQRLPAADSRAPEPAQSLIAAIRDATGARHDADAAARLLAVAQPLLPTLTPAAATSLQRICRDAVADAIERVHVTVPAVGALRRLQDAASAFTAVAPAAALPALLTAHEHADPQQAAQLALEYADAPRAVLGAVLLTRACDAHVRGAAAQCEQLARAAAALLERGGPGARELARQVLAERRAQEQEIVDMPGGDALLPILGGNAQQAALVRRIVAAIDSLSASAEQGIAALAGAVFAAHAQQYRISANSDGSERIRGALRAFAKQRTNGNGPAVEVCLDLLGVITEATHLPALEDAALGEAMTIRLQRLDRSVAHCRTAEAEDRYERYANALEAADVPIDPAVRERLRSALGTRGIKRRLLQVVSSVIEGDAS